MTNNTVGHFAPPCCQSTYSLSEGYMYIKLTHVLDRKKAKNTYEGTDNVSNDTALWTVRQKIGQNGDGRSGKWLEMRLFRERPTLILDGSFIMADHLK